MNYTNCFLGIIALLLLVACGGTAVEEPTSSSSGAAAQIFTENEDSLSLNAQLAIGTLLLEGSALAVSESQSETLLPLWQALQGLSISGTAADIELKAVTNQIQAEMSPEQIAAITEMNLTEASLQELIQNNTIQLRGPNQGGNLDSGQGGAGGNRPAGGLGGGLRGGGVEGLDPATVQTRQAERGAGSTGSGADSLTFNAVIRLLETKMGIEQIQQFNDFLLYQSLGLTLNMSVQEIGSAIEEGQTIATFIEVNGENVEDVRRSLLTSLDGIVLPEDQSAEVLVDQFLDGEFQVRPRQEGNNNNG